MRILLSNDDGYEAPGLLALAKALAPGNELHICAPAEERSGAGHGLTLRGGLVWQHAVRHGELPGVPREYVHGTPADAVKFALEHIYRGVKFDLVVSGINSVLNLGTDTVYSGTFGAAEEGTLLGVPSMAVSVRAGRGGYDLAAEFVAKNLEKLTADIPPFVTLNVNLPSGIREEIRGIKVTPLGHRKYEDYYEDAPEGFRLRGCPVDRADDDADDDCKWSDAGYITLTPVRTSVSDGGMLRALGEKRWEL